MTYCSLAVGVLDRRSRHLCVHHSASACTLPHVGHAPEGRGQAPEVQGHCSPQAGLHNAQATPCLCTHTSSDNIRPVMAMPTCPSSTQVALGPVQLSRRG